MSTYSEIARASSRGESSLLPSNVRFDLREFELDVPKQTALASPKCRRTRGISAIHHLKYLGTNTKRACQRLTGEPGFLTMRLCTVHLPRTDHPPRGEPSTPSPTLEAQGPGAFVNGMASTVESSIWKHEVDTRHPFVRVS